MTDYLGLAKQAIREREQRLAADGERFIDRAESLKGHAVELWHAGQRYFIVTDQAGARAVVERGMGSRGEVWTSAEIEVAVQITDKSARDEVERWKRRFDGRLRGEVGAYSGSPTRGHGFNCRKLPIRTEKSTGGPRRLRLQIRPALPLRRSLDDQTT